MMVYLVCNKRSFADFRTDCVKLAARGHIPHERASRRWWRKRVGKRRDDAKGERDLQQNNFDSDSK